jgi:phage gpG-like protein
MKEFGSIEAFVSHLATVAVAVREADHAILEEAAEKVEKRAKKKIGEYQDQVGPFIAWPELAEATKADRVKQGYPEDEPLLRSGEMRDSIEHTVGRDEAQIGSNNDKAVWQELGTEHIPPRSFLGGAMAELVPEILSVSGRRFMGALVGEKVFQGVLPIGESDV